MQRGLRALSVLALALALALCACNDAAPPSSALTAAGATEPWAGLRRPWTPPPPLDGGCPTTPSAIVAEYFGPALGPGPVYPAVGLLGPLSLASGPPDEAGLFPLKILWVAAPRYPGPALVRARRLDGPGVVRLDSAASADNATPQAELRLLDSAVSPTDGWRQWPSYIRVAGPGCYAYQVDGTDFSYTVVVLVTP